MKKLFCFLVCILIFCSFCVPAFADDEVLESDTIQEFLDNSDMQDFSQRIDDTHIDVSYSDNVGSYLSMTGDTDTVEDLLNSALGSAPDDSLVLMNNGIAQLPPGYEIDNARVLKSGEIPTNDFPILRDILNILTVSCYYSVYTAENSDGEVITFIDNYNPYLFLLCEVLCSVFFLYIFFRFIGVVISKL